MHMRIIRNYQNVDYAARGASVAIGNFDGVHLGHQSVINIARSEAKAMDAPLGILTFEPHPRTYFTPHGPPFRLMSTAARQTRLRKIGVDILFELNFSDILSSFSPREFAENVLKEGLGLAHVVVGADFCFGKDRSGTSNHLRIFGEEMGFAVTVAPLISAGLGEVSSTSIRNALEEGRTKDAADQLGHWHRLEGPVIVGEQRGRELGYPTANMSIDGLHLPKFGVYAVLIDVQDGPHKGAYHGAASIGVRPMFGENSPNLETFIFDFSGDLYGASLSVALVDFLRPEENFDDVEDLIEQMQKDCSMAHKILSSLS